jgi:hypothetical protein
MRAVTRRIRRLEDQFGSVNGTDLLVVTSRVGLALDADACVQILRECGFVPTFGIGIVRLTEIPDGLNVGETERYLREHGAELCRQSNCRQQTK